MFNTMSQSGWSFRSSSTVSRNLLTSMVPFPASSRICRWATAAPAFQQAYTSSAISAGVMGTLGLFSFLGHAPVVATVMMVFFIAIHLVFASRAFCFAPII